MEMTADLAQVLEVMDRRYLGYCSMNGDLVQEDSDYAAPRHIAPADLIIRQDEDAFRFQWKEPVNAFQSQQTYSICQRTFRLSSVI